MSLPLNFSRNVCKLRTYYSRTWSFPTKEETHSILGLRSEKATRTFFKLLIAGRFVYKSDDQWTPTEKMTGVPYITDDTVPAWFPTPGRDDDQYVSFDLSKRLIPDPNATIILQVSWESMIEAGIHDGDRVIVHQLGTPTHGCIVVAIIDGGYTLKYFNHDDDGSIYLTAANSMLYPDPFYPTESLQIFGVVTGMFREFHR